MPWMAIKAQQLENQAARLLAKYRRLERLAARRTGEARAELLDRMSETKGRHQEALAAAARLRNRSKI